MTDKSNWTNKNRDILKKLEKEGKYDRFAAPWDKDATVVPDEIKALAKGVKNVSKKQKKYKKEGKE
jgi:hypothetical protein|tara:strand:+ start:148 stop:345 length:198 start_codon:yes stop_codon:yes gene_type:complete